MLTPRRSRPPAEPAPPLTHAAYLRALHERKAPGRPRVQARVFDRACGPVVVCTHVVEMQARDGTGAVEWFKVDALGERRSLPGSRLRLCSGDGRCTCDPDDAPQAAGSARERPC